MKENWEGKENLLEAQSNFLYVEHAVGAEFTMEGIKEVVFFFKSLKMPGSDGFSFSFFKGNGNFVRMIC